MAILSEDALGRPEHGVLDIGGQGASFVAAGAAFVVDIVVSVIVTVHDPAEAGVASCAAWSTPRRPRRTSPTASRAATHWWLSPTKLAGVSLAMVIVLNIIFR